MTTITIDPVTRLEGHLAVKVDIENGVVARAYSKGEMFRGFEQILRGRDPLDAQQITQRICGVCPVSHATAAVLAQDDAYGITPPPNGRILRNLTLAANYIQSHIVHFYVLAALDYVDIAALLNYEGEDTVLRDLKGWVGTQLNSKLVYPAAPFLPRYEGGYIPDGPINFMAIRHYVEALEMRRLAHQMVAIFGGKVPHVAALVPGGVTERVSARQIIAYRSKLSRLRDFIDRAYLPDVVTVAGAFPDYFTLGKGHGNYMAYGVFPESDQPEDKLFPSGIVVDGKLQEFDHKLITEQVKHSLFADSSTNLYPSQGRTEPEPKKSNAYSWLKAPRYGGKVMEVGPLARVLVAYHRGKHPELNQMVDGLLARFGAGPEVLNSVLGRHAARAIECKFLADRCDQWLSQLKPGEAAFTDFTIPEQGSGMGLTEAPRGALGHWVEIAGHKISNYQCIVPSTWNCSPRDDQDQPGAMEQAIATTPVQNPEHPLEVARIVRSFDPCLACAVH